MPQPVVAIRRDHPGVFTHAASFFCHLRLHAFSPGGRASKRLVTSRKLISLVAIGFSVLPAAFGQTTVDTIHVQVLNGRSGKPVKRAHVTVDVYPKAKYETPVPFTADLGGSFSLLVDHAGEISTRTQAHPACEHLSRAARKQPPTPFPVAEIMSTGTVSPNTCGRRSAAPRPGTLILYVRSAPWWQRFF